MALLFEHRPPTGGPPQLVDASKITGMLKFTGVGEKVNCAVGGGAGGRITPGGTSRMVVISGFVKAKFAPVAVATMLTHVPGSELQVPKTPFDGLGGAVNTTDAVPSLPVTIV